AREEDLPEPGSFVTRAIGPERVLIVRGADGVLRAFYNVCRHRGARLVEEESGTLRGAIACPYHAWTYELDGQLRQAPRMDLAGRAERLALIGMPLGTAHGFVFVCCDPDAEPLDRALADLPDWSRFGLGRLRRVRALEYAVAA